MKLESEIYRYTGTIINGKTFVLMDRTNLSSVKSQNSEDWVKFSDIIDTLSNQSNLDISYLNRIIATYDVSGFQKAHSRQPSNPPGSIIEGSVSFGRYTSKMDVYLMLSYDLINECLGGNDYSLRALTHELAHCHLISTFTNSSNRDIIWYPPRLFGSKENQYKSIICLWDEYQAERRAATAYPKRNQSFQYQINAEMDKFEKWLTISPPIGHEWKHSLISIIEQLLMYELAHNHANGDFSSTIQSMIDGRPQCQAQFEKQLQSFESELNKIFTHCPDTTELKDFDPLRITYLELVNSLNSILGK